MKQKARNCYSIASSKFFGTCNISSAVDMFVLALCYQLYGPIKENKKTLHFTLNIIVCLLFC